MSGQLPVMSASSAYTGCRCTCSSIMAERMASAAQYMHLPHLEARKLLYSLLFLRGQLATMCTATTTVAAAATATW